MLYPLESLKKLNPARLCDSRRTALEVRIFSNRGNIRFNVYITHCTPSLKGLPLGCGEGEAGKCGDFKELRDMCVAAGGSVGRANDLCSSQGHRAPRHFISAKRAARGKRKSLCPPVSPFCRAPPPPSAIRERGRHPQAGARFALSVSTGPPPTPLSLAQGSITAAVFTPSPSQRFTA